MTMEWADEILPLVTFLQSANIAEIMMWLRERAEGNDTVGTDREDPPHLLIASMYEGLDHAICVNLEKALHLLIAEIASDPLEWSTNAVNELLMMADPVLLPSSRREDLAALLSRLARPE